MSLVTAHITYLLKVSHFALFLILSSRLEFQEISHIPQWKRAAIHLFDLGPGLSACSGLSGTSASSSPGIQPPLASESRALASWSTIYLSLTDD